MGPPYTILRDFDNISFGGGKTIDVGWPSLAQSRVVFG